MFLEGLPVDVLSFLAQNMEEVYFVKGDNIITQVNECKHHISFYHASLAELSTFLSDLAPEHDLYLIWWSNQTSISLFQTYLRWIPLVLSYLSKIIRYYWTLLGWLRRFFFRAGNGCRGCNGKNWILEESKQSIVMHFSTLSTVSLANRTIYKIGVIKFL